MSLDHDIQSIVSRAAADIARAVRHDIAAQIQRLVGGAAAAAPSKPAAAAPKGRKPAARGGRRRGVDEKSIDTVYQYVVKNPGKRSEEIQKSAGLSPDVAKKALLKLREAGKLKTKGAKRATTYSAA